MLRKLGTAVAMALVLLPIGGLPHLAYAAPAQAAATFGTGGVPTLFGAIAGGLAVLLFCTGLHGALARRAGVRRREVLA